MSRGLGTADEAPLAGEQQALLAALARVHLASGARALLLIDVGGRLLAEVGETKDLDVAAFASLTARNIATTAALARLVGEEDFSILFHQGRKDSIHISLLGDSAILAVIFGRSASLGMVRLRVGKAAAEIQRIVQKLQRRRSLPGRLESSPLCDITERDIDEFFTV